MSGRTQPGWHRVLRMRPQVADSGVEYNLTPARGINPLAALSYRLAQPIIEEIIANDLDALVKLEAIILPDTVAHGRLVWVATSMARSRNRTLSIPPPVQPHVPERKTATSQPANLNNRPDLTEQDVCTRARQLGRAECLTPTSSRCAIRRPPRSRRQPLTGPDPRRAPGAAAAAGGG